MRIFTSILVVASVLVPAPAWGQQPNTPQAMLNVDLNGQFQASTGPIHINVPPRTTLQIYLYSTSASAPIFFGISPALASPGLATTGGQFLDLDLAGLELYSSLLPGLLNSFFQLNGANYFETAFVAPPAVGQTVCFQAAVVDPSAPGPDPVTLSAAWAVHTVEMQPLTMFDNGFVNYPLGWNFPFYGFPMSEVVIDPNGRLTFIWGVPDQWIENEAAMRLGPGSISVFWDDLTPFGSDTAYGTNALIGAGDILAVSDPVAQTFTCIFQDVGEHPGTGSNTATVTLNASGVITVAYGACTLQDAISGICFGWNYDPVMGHGLTDLSACAGGPGCPAVPVAYRTIFEIFDGTTSAFDLSNTTLHYVPVGSGDRYIVQ